MSNKNVTFEEKPKIHNLEESYYQYLKKQQQQQLQHYEEELKKKLEEFEKMKKKHDEQCCRQNCTVSFGKTKKKVYVGSRGGSYYKRKGRKVYLKN